METTTETARERYIAKLPTMTGTQLLNDFASATRQNEYGSHDDQLALLRTELLGRMEATR